MGRRHARVNQSGRAEGGFEPAVSACITPAGQDKGGPHARLRPRPGKSGGMVKHGAQHSRPWRRWPDEYAKRAQEMQVKEARLRGILSRQNAEKYVDQSFRPAF